MKGRKSPAPDQLQACFLQKYRHILRTKITHIVLCVLNNRDNICACNDTNIALIPKIKFLTLVKDYRPIGLYNVIYKLISKIIANRLKPLLPTVVHDS